MTHPERLYLYCVSTKNETEKEVLWRPDLTFPNVVVSWALDFLEDTQTLILPLFPTLPPFLPLTLPSRYRGSDRTPLYLWDEEGGRVCTSLNKMVWTLLNHDHYETWHLSPPPSPVENPTKESRIKEYEVSKPSKLCRIHLKDPDMRRKRVKGILQNLQMGVGTEESNYLHRSPGETESSTFYFVSTRINERSSPRNNWSYRYRNEDSDRSSVTPTQLLSRWLNNRITDSG